MAQRLRSNTPGPQPNRLWASGKRPDCRENDLLASNANRAEFSVERLFSLNYVERTFCSRLVAGLAFFTSNEALACGFHPW
jgi:hypothetical protein